MAKKIKFEKLVIYRVGNLLIGFSERIAHFCVSERAR